jgi:hypothetical protein
MPPITLFHGTTPQVANQLVNGKIQIAMGGGEFGQGFYMGTSKRLAKRRAFHKTYASNGTAHAAMSIHGNTFSIELDEVRHASVYSCRQLNLKQSIGLYGSIRRHNLYASIIDQNDAIVGAIVGSSRYYNVIQYKFQSQRVEQSLNTGCPHSTVGQHKII